MIILKIGIKKLRDKYIIYNPYYGKGLSKKDYINKSYKYLYGKIHGFKYFGIQALMILLNILLNKLIKIHSNYMSKFSVNPELKSELDKNLSKFNIKIYEGLESFYAPNGSKIVIDNPNNVATIFHELGHALDFNIHPKFEIIRSKIRMADMVSESKFNIYLSSAIYYSGYIEGRLRAKQFFTKGKFKCIPYTLFIKSGLSAATLSQELTASIRAMYFVIKHKGPVSHSLLHLSMAFSTYLTNFLGNLALIKSGYNSGILVEMNKIVRKGTY